MEKNIQQQIGNIRRKISKLIEALWFQLSSKMIKQKIDQCEFLVFLEILIDYILKSWAKPIEKKTPPKREVEIFWKDIWLQGTEHNATAPWIQPEYEKKKIDRMEWHERKTQKQNSKGLSTLQRISGIVGISNFWLKKLTAIHKKLIASFNEFMNDVLSMPYWLTKERTFLLLKSGKTELEKDFRPITCSNNTYELLTRIITSYK